MRRPTTPRARRAAPFLALGLLLLGGNPSAARQEPAPSGTQDAPPAEQPPAEQAPADAVSILKQLERLRDDAEVDLIRKLGALLTPEALDGLFKVYDLMNSLYMKRAVLLALPQFDAVPGLDQRALQRLLDVATASEERELRLASVQAIAGCQVHGGAFLKMIVGSNADEEVRVAALEEHIGVGTADDRAWYREIALPSKDDKDGDKEKEKDKKKGKDKEPAPESTKGKSLPRLRLIAFKVVASSLTADELEQSTRDREPEIREQALLGLIAADEKRGTERAEDVYSNFEERPGIRAVAARALASAHGADAAKRFAKDALSEADMPLELVHALADLIARYGDQDCEKELGKALNSGKPSEQLFALRGLEKAKGEKLEKAILKLVKSKDVVLACAAMKTLGARGVEEAEPELEKMVTKGKDQELVAAALDALSALRKGKPEWQARVLAMTADEAQEIRNAAVAQVGKLGSAAPLDALEKALAHEDWSTRLAAVHALEATRQPAAVGLLVARMAHEQGRMKHEIAEVLFRLTGQMHGQREVLWKAWWEKEGATFQLITPEELAKRRKEEEVRRLKDVTRESSSFFGVRIISRRVIFVIDVSGSMEEKAESGKTRMELAREEMLQTLDKLDPATFFNIVPFSSEVDAWQERIGGVDTAAGKGQKSLIEQAKDYVERLRAGGGTNIYGALERAFQDPEVDSIYLMTDGEPSVGEIIDATGIREAVQRWNDRRGVVVHTIAFGGTFPILEWLAEDSGGTYRFVR